MYEIIVGRDDDDRRAFGSKGTFLLGKHYVKMGQTTSLSTPIFMDALRSHVVAIFGKRGSGKSYTLASIAEGMMSLDADLTRNLGIVIFDTMGVFWTMKYENKKDESLLKEWGLENRKFNICIYSPERNKEMPADLPFSISPNELSAEDWCSIFGIEQTSQFGALIGRICGSMPEDYQIEDLIDAARKDERCSEETKSAVENMLYTAKSWGLFGSKSTPVSELACGGQITILDLSAYAGAKGNIRALVISIISRKLFSERMAVRKSEEYASIKSATSFARTQSKTKDIPLIWLMVDEAHEFLPKQGQTPASEALITILREGRQPGISLILASQQPGQIHTDVMTQADVVISHRLTAKIDVDALGTLMQSYMREGLDKFLNELPDVKGAALIFDDINERIYPMRVRPRITWHGGSSPSLVNEALKL